MVNSADLFNQAVHNHQAGQLALAESLYRRILQTDPSHADAHHMLGILMHQSRQPESAVTLVRQAITLAPLAPAYHFSLGNIFMAQGKLPEAADCFTQTLGFDPQHPQAHNSLGVILQGQGKITEAIDSYRQALRFNPQNLSALNNLATALMVQGQLNEAMECLREALRIRPDYAMAHVNLGNILKDHGQLAEAVQSFRQAARLNPDMPEAHYNLGNAHLEQGQLAEAVQAFRQTLTINPNHAEAHYNLGNSLTQQGLIEDALASFRQAIQIRPTYADAHVNLGNALKEQGCLEEALACFQTARTLEPHNQAWHCNYLFSLLYHPQYDSPALYEEHRQWEREHAQALAPVALNFANTPDPERRLRIGYISPDFRDHVNGFIVLPLLRHHDHRQFELFLYANRAKSDGGTLPFRQCADHWCAIADWSDERVASKIREDGIDILVDVTVHMAGNRLLVFARKPAPIQVTYAGYPGTTGLKTMDYRLTDPYLDPPGLFEAWYSEETYRLPHTFWCYDPPADEPQVGLLPALEKGFITFGCLNNFCKVNDGVLELWSRVLRAVPGSHLRLLAPESSHRQRTLAFLAQQGISAERIHFCARRPRLEYLALNHHIDIGLDTLPYNGHTTSMDSLWMGVPVVTLVGNTVVGRAGLSQLTNLGLQELAATTPDEFTRLAVNLAGDVGWLKELRATLRARMKQSPLMDAMGFTRGVEEAYRTMWRKWCTQATV